MDPTTLPAGMPPPGTPGHSAWVRRYLDEHVVNLRDGLPEGQRFEVRRVGSHVVSLLDHARVVPVARSDGTLLHAQKPDLPVYLQEVRPAELWDDPVAVLALERLIGPMLAVGCAPSGDLELVLAADAGGSRVDRALARPSILHIVGTGGQPLPISADPPPPHPPRQARPPRVAAPLLGDPGYIAHLEAKPSDRGARIAE